MQQKTPKNNKTKSLLKPKQVTGFASRKVALETLLAAERTSVFVNVALSQALQKKDLSERDKAFVTALVQGVLRHRDQLDEQIDEVSTRPGAKIDITTRNILRLGILQLFFMPNIPQQAVFNTATELAKVLGHSGLGKFTNGVLRSVAKGNTQATIPSDQIISPEALAKSFSIPEWMIERWLTNFGQEETLKLLEHSQSTPPLTIRTCEIAITPEGLLEMLERKGLRVRYGELVKSCLVLDRGRTSADNDGERKSSPCSKVQEPFMKSSKTASAFRGSPTKLAGYDEGLFSVQDEAAAFVSFVLDPKPGELVIDLCAAPGGKTVHAAEIMQNKGRVIAVDQSASRLSHLKSSRTRLGLKNIEIVVHDGRTFKCDMLADRVLVDAPCTGTGVINRLSDLRFKKKPEDLISLTQLQRELLANAVSLLKPGGVLVYSTCSIEPEENFANAQWFLDNFPDFEPDDISSFIPQWIMQECFPTIQGPLCKTKKEDSCLHMIQLLPPRHKVSGFFVARFRKKTN